MIESMWFLFGGVCAPLLSAIAFLIWVQPWRSVSKFSTTIAWAIAVLEGFGLGYLLLLVSKRALPLPPVEASHLLVMVALPIVALVESIGAIEIIPSTFRWILRWITLAIIPALLLQPYLKNTWSLGQSAAWIGGLAATLILGRWALQHMTKNSQERWGWLAMGISAAGAGVTMLSSGSIELGQAGLTLAMALGGTWIIAVILRAPGFIDAGLGVAWAMLVSLLICAHFYAELSMLNMVILTLAPLSGWIAKMPALQRRGVITRAIVVLILSIIIVALAAAPAARKAMLETESNSEYPYGS